MLMRGNVRKTRHIAPRSPLWPCWSLMEKGEREMFVCPAVRSGLGMCHLPGSQDTSEQNLHPSFLFSKTGSLVSPNTLPIVCLSPLVYLRGGFSPNILCLLTPRGYNG